MCVTENKNDYKQIAVIPEELIDKPEIIESLKIVEEANKKLVNWVSVIKKTKEFGWWFQNDKKENKQKIWPPDVVIPKKLKTDFEKKNTLNLNEPFFQLYIYVKLLIPPIPTKNL